MMVVSAIVFCPSSFFSLFSLFFIFLICFSRKKREGEGWEDERLKKKKYEERALTQSLSFFCFFLKCNRMELYGF